VLVVGDVNSTIACGLVAVKLGVRLVHVEAGLRSFDREMPEEINRVLTDAISDLLFCTEQSGVDNLRREGIAPEKIHLVGNVMIDTLLRHRERAEQSHVLETFGLRDGLYAVLTLHRPSNVDDPVVLAKLLDVLEVVLADQPLVFPVHPRTRAKLAQFGLAGRVAAQPDLRLVDPVGYLDFLKLMAHARVVLTDSGGIQEETTILGVPCLTLRENTERPVTVELGTNRLVGQQPESILAAYREVMAARGASGRRSAALGRRRRRADRGRAARGAVAAFASSRLRAARGRLRTARAGCARCRPSRSGARTRRPRLISIERARGVNSADSIAAASASVLCGSA
jgi:UDP-N-acetylglucosamine 2-epimerase (non-hydrolysing)